MSVDAFRSIDCAGLGRVDFLMTYSGDIFLNEINTMPGFTPISMYPRLWQASGIAYPALIDELIQLALARHRETQQISVNR
jgi:D-alanine-D-alanine ligase